MDLDVPPVSSPMPYTFLGSTEVGGSYFHSLSTMAYTLSLNFDYIVKVHVDMEGYLAAIEDECRKVIEAQDATDLTLYKSESELEKLQKSHSVT